MNKTKSSLFNNITQWALPILTIGAQILTSLKYPEFGLIVNMISQPFWIYAAWKAYREANQIGLLVNSIVFSIVTLFGILNYWLF